MIDPYLSLAEAIIRSWRRGGRKSRVSLVAVLLLLLGASLIFVLGESKLLLPDIAKNVAGGLALSAGFILIGVIAYQRQLAQEKSREVIEDVEQRARAHPEQPQFAWDLARTKLESYLDRNLGQVRHIFWLTLVVMLTGFGLIMYGLVRAFDAPDRLPVSIVAAVSGVLVSFIGGSFLLIYKAVMEQSKGYVTVLERINAVGMAVQVISNIPDSSAELKHGTTAELSKQLLAIYAQQPPATGKASDGEG